MAAAVQRCVKSILGITYIHVKTGGRFTVGLFTGAIDGGVQYSSTGMEVEPL